MSNLFKNILSLFKKEERFPVIVWDTKTMSYKHLTQKEINEIETNPKYEGWSVTPNESSHEQP